MPKVLRFSSVVLLLCVYQTLFSNSKFYSDQKPPGSIVFTENKGQVGDQHSKPRPDVLFSGQAGPMVFHLRNNGISYQFLKVEDWKTIADPTVPQGGSTKKSKIQIPAKTNIYRLDITWINAKTAFNIEKEGIVDGYMNFYNETCPNGVYNVHSFESVKFNELYAGTTLHYYQKEGSLKYDYLLDAGADYKQIKMRIDGADQLRLTFNGDLIISTPLGDIIEKAPIVFQSGKILNSSWVLEKNVIGFEIDGLNTTEPYVIDPLVRSWGTYYGGVTEDLAEATCTDAAGNVFMSGNASANTGTIIATTGSHQLTHGGGFFDVFLAKFNASGVRLWATYYGGNGMEYLSDCATDSGNNVYLCGTTESTISISTPGSHQPINGNGNAVNGFLVKFNSSGQRQWGTYYGGAADDHGTGCAVDPSDNVYLCGIVTSSIGTAIATPGSHQPTHGGMVFDAFLAKFNSSGQRQWGTYYGGNGDGTGCYDRGLSCATDPSGNVFMSGYSATSTGTVIASANGHQPLYAGGISDAFLVKFNSAGVRQWGTYYGGPDDEDARACAVDKSGNVVITGYAYNYTVNVVATAGCHQPTIGGGYPASAYLAKFSGAGVRKWGTYYGMQTVGEDCAVDAYGNSYLCGVTSDAAPGTLIATASGYQTVYGGVADAFAAKFDSLGVRRWGTFYGGAAQEWGKAICVYAGQVIYLAGETNSNTAGVIESANGHQLTCGGDVDAFLVKLNCTAPNVSVTSNKTFICKGESAVLTTTGATTYLWNSGAATNTISISPGATTSYTVIGFDALGCPVEAVYSQSVNACLELLASSENERVLVYPNPNDGKFIVEGKYQTQIIITNLLGEVVLQQKVLEGKNEIDVEKQSAGIYFVSFLNSEDIYTIKIIKE